MINIRLYGSDNGFLEKLKVKKPVRFILYRGRLFERIGIEGSKLYIQRSYLEIN